MLANYTYGNNNQGNNMVSPAVTYPVSLMTQYAYKDPQFALGNLIGSYLANKYLGNIMGGENNGTGTPAPASDADFQNTLNANIGNKFSLDANGNALYNTSAFLPATYSDAAVTGGGIAGTSFKDYLNNINQNNASGLLNYQQLSQQAGIIPQEQAVAQTGQAVGGLLPTSTPATIGTGSIPPIDGSLGLKMGGNTSFNIGGGLSPFSNGWTYNNPYLKKDRGDIAGQGAVSPENASADSAVYTIDEKFPGMIKEGNIDLASRPVVHLPDGSIATVRSIGVNIGGKEYLLPTVSQDGRLLSNDEAVDEFKRTGKYLGIFDSPEASDRYAEALHNQQDKMYTRRSENEADNLQPIQPVDKNPIKPANEYPIRESAPITEDKKEVLNGNNLRIMSANDGQVYDFTVSDDGNWITFGNARMPIQSKNQLISAMHDPNQSFRNIEEMATSVHNNTPVMSESDAAIIAQDPSRRTEWLNLINNRDRRDMTDTDNSGVYPTWYISANNAMRNAQNNPNTLIDSNAPQPVNVDEWQRDFAIRQLRRGVSPEAINSMLSVLKPEMQRREEDYNRYQESAIWPTYYAAIQQGDYGAAAQLGEAMLQYNPSLGSMMLDNLPGGRDYYTSAEAARRAERQQAANIAAEQRNRQYKIEDSNREYQQSVNLKMLDHKLSQIDKAWDYQQKLSFQRASNQDKVDMLTNAGMSPQEATFTVYGGKKSGRSSGESSSNKAFSRAMQIIRSYNSYEGDGPNPYAAAYPAAQDVVNNYGLVPLTSNNDYYQAMSWITDRLERNNALGNPYSKEQMMQLIDNSLEPNTAESVKDSINWQDYFG